MKVTDLIASRKEIYFIGEDATVHDAARYLRDRGVRSVGVCNKDGKAGRRGFAERRLG